MGSGPEIIKKLCVRAEHHRHFTELVLIGGFGFLAIASSRGGGATGNID